MCLGIESPCVTTSNSLVRTGLHQPGCVSAESTQHGFMQRFKQHMPQKHLAITALQPCHDADMFSAPLKRPGNGQVSEISSDR